MGKQNRELSDPLGVTPQRRRRLTRRPPRRGSSMLIGTAATKHTSVAPHHSPQRRPVSVVLVQHLSAAVLLGTEQLQSRRSASVQSNAARSPGTCAKTAAPAEKPQSRCMSKEKKTDTVTSWATAQLRSYTITVPIFSSSHPKSPYLQGLIPPTR